MLALPDTGSDSEVEQCPRAELNDCPVIRYRRTCIAPVHQGADRADACNARMHGLAHLVGSIRLRTRAACVSTLSALCTFWAWQCKLMRSWQPLAHPKYIAVRTIASKYSSRRLEGLSSRLHHHACRPCGERESRYLEVSGRVKCGL